MPQRMSLAVIVAGVLLVTLGAVIHVAAIGAVTIFGGRPTGALSIALKVAPWSATGMAAVVLWCTLVHSSPIRLAFAAWVGSIVITLIAVALGPGTTANAEVHLAIAILGIGAAGWAVEYRLRTRPNVRCS